MQRNRYRRFGLLGYPLGHSLSPWIHQRIMEIAGIPGEYKLYPLKPEELASDLPKLLASLDGSNCTIPYKESIIPYLQGCAPCAAAYGAVNTVHGRVGYNTDGIGFAACEVPLKGRSVCILGAGGVARVFALEAVRAGAREISILARTPQRAEALVQDVKAHGYSNILALGPEAGPVNCDICLNGTPVGMWPKVRGLPAENQELKVGEGVFDGIYNPTATRFLLQAKGQGIWAKGGLQMLFEQALAAQKIWNPEVDFQAWSSELAALKGGLAREVLRQSPIKLVLSGFMGSGKSTVGSALAKALALPFVDLDESIVEVADQTIPEIFQTQGEASFRKLEREVFLAELKRPEALVLAAGGGTLVQEGMEDILGESRALVIYLDVSLPTAIKRVGRDQGRPMLGSGLAETEALYVSRRPSYESYADLRVPAEGDLAQIVNEIMSAFEWQG